MEDDINHDGCTDECGDRVDGQVAVEARQSCDEVAEQRQVHADGCCGRQQHEVIAGVIGEPGQVWNCQPDEGDGTAESSDDSHQKT